MTAKIKISRESDPWILCRRGLLNTLMLGPASKEGLICSAVYEFGFTRQQVIAAARWLNVMEEVRDGMVYWIKPDVLVPIPRWCFRTPRHRCSTSAA